MITKQEKQGQQGVKHQVSQCMWFQITYLIVWDIFFPMSLWIWPITKKMIQFE